MPTFALMAVVNEILAIMRERGEEVRDWDNKEKVVQRMSSIGGKFYILAPSQKPTEAETHGEENKNGDEEGR